MTDQQDDGGGAVSFPLSATVTTTRWSDSGSIPANTSGHCIDVRAPTGARVVGGGFEGGFPDTGSGGLLVTASMPGVDGDSSAEGWKAYFTNTTSDPQTVFVFAICVS